MSPAQATVTFHVPLASFGTVTVTVPKLAKGTWKVTVAWAGDKTYQSASASGASIKVTK